MITELTSVEAWEKVWTEQLQSDSAALLIFKKSPICPTSLAAEDEFKHWVASLADHDACQVATVDVVNCRPVSKQIEADTGVMHQSPQAILVKAEGSVAWNASHSTITHEQLRNAVQAL